MNLNFAFDASAASAPSWFASAVSTVAGVFDALITNPISVTIDVGWGEEDNTSIPSGSAAASQSYGDLLDYGTVLGALSSHATSATDAAALSALPNTNPTGNGQFLVPDALQKALGLTSAAGSSPDGFVGLNSQLTWSSDLGGHVSSGQYDPIGALEHEVSEVLGRFGVLGADGQPGVYGPMDLFRYTAPGQRDTTPGPGYFSVDGQTMGLPFNDPTHGGDAADWSGTVTGDAFGTSDAGLTGALSATDLQVLDALGYSVASSGVPAPQASAPVPQASLPVPQASAPTITLNPTVAFKGPHVAVFSGTVSDPSASVEVFAGSKDLGAANVFGDGTWRLVATLPTHAKVPLTATATDAAGQGSTTSPSLILRTGIPGSRFATAVQVYDSNGNLIGATGVGKAGTVRSQGATAATAQSSAAAGATAGAHAAAAGIHLWSGAGRNFNPFGGVHGAPVPPAWFGSNRPNGARDGGQDPLWQQAGAGSHLPSSHHPQLYA